MIFFETNTQGIILSGGPDKMLTHLIKINIPDTCIPILGICYGAQLLVK